MARDGRVAVVSFFVFLVLANASADISKCNSGCHGSSKPTGGYLPGTAYTYAIEGLAKVQLSSADHQETSVKLSAQATITSLGNCAHLLKITSLQITGPDGTAYQKPRNIEKPVRFTLQDGVLGSDICAEQDDNQASVNIKRAILSLLQTANKHNTEVDVFGVCPTSFKVHKDGANTVITKYRDLNACAQREQGKHDLISSIYNPNAEIKSANIIDSNLRVETVLKNGVVQKTEAIEDYLYVPFSSGSSGAKAQVNTKIVLKDTKTGFNIQANCVVPKTIIFENPHLMNIEHSNTDKIQLALKTASQSMENHVDSKSASIFMNLVRILRVSNKNDIQSVYNQIKGGSSVQNNNFIRRVFLDALFRAGSGDSVEVLVDLVQKKELSPLEQRLAFVSLAAVQHASSNSVKAAIKLLDMPDVTGSVYLGVGALAGAYCRDHNCHGATSQDVNIAALSNKLASKLGNCKSKDKKSETMIIYALKGIKNIHHLEDSIVAKLASCASDTSVKQRVRVAALETFAADPCIKQLKSTALSILKDTQQDSEVRIKAYLALLDCPCANVAGELKKILDDEPVYQVGAFISSSLKNIRSSANPARKTAKEHFGLIYPKKTYPFDVRKYSQNFELSYEYEMLGIGSVADANVIYSQDSFMPRSANLNLTAEIFGRNVNLIELGYRQGNLDRIYEEYFGPQGAINTHTPQQIYQDVKKTTSSLFDKIKQRMQETRGKRSVLQQTNNFGKQLKHDIEGYNGNVDLDIFLKMFGSEIVFLSLGDDKPTTIETLVDKFFDMMDSTVADAKQFTHEIRNHMILLDSELVFPTSTGFVLKLNSEAVSTTKIQFAGNVDLKQIMNDPKNSKIDIKLIPSANIEAAGTLLIDADVVATGLKVMSSLHTSTGSHIVAKLLDNGQGFDMQLGLPIDKQEFITANHEIMYITRPKGAQEVAKDIKFDGSNRYQFSGCFDQLSSAIGLTLCSDISIPWQPTADHNNNKKSITTIAKGPLSGPAKFAVRLEKEDLNGFHIVGMYKTVKDSQKTLDITVEANGSKKNRKVSFVADVVNRDDRRSFKVSLNSPVSSANLEAETVMMNTHSEKSLMARFLYDKSEYLGKIGVLVSGNQAKQIYTPIFNVKIPQENKGNEFIKTEGTLIRTESGKIVKFNANNLKLKGSVDLTADGWWQYEGGNGQLDLKLTSDKNKFSVAGKYKTQDNSYNGNWDVHNTLNPAFDFHLDVNAANKGNDKLFDIVLVHGPDAKSKTNKITYSSTTRNTDSDKIDFYFKNKFSYPLWQLQFETETEVKPTKFKTQLEGTYEQAKSEFVIELQKDMKTVNDFYGKFKAKVNDNGIGTEFKFDVTGEDKGNFVGKLDLYPGDKHEATGTVNYHMATDDTNVGLSVKYKYSGDRNEFKFDVGLVQNLKLYNSFCKMSLGNTDYIDFLLKINQEPAPTGNLKLILKDFVKCEGQFKVNPQDKKGNGVLLIAFLKANKKVKIDTNFLMSQPHYNLNVDIYYDHEKDNSKKITLTTTNLLAGDSIDSKASLLTGKEKLDFTFKGEVSLSNGPFFSGKQNFYTTLSHTNGQSFALKVDRQLNTENDIIGRVDTQLTYIPMKNGKPYKIALQGKINTHNNLDYEEHLTFVNPTGENLDIKLYIKRSDKEGRSIYENQFELSGALSPSTISYYGSFDMNNDDNDDLGDVKYRVKAAYGPKASVDASGKLSYDIRKDADTLFKNDVDVTLVLPFENAHNIKLTFNDMYSEPKDGSHFDVKSTFGAQVDANVYKYDIRVLLGEGTGEGKLNVQVPNYNKFAIQTKYKRTKEDGKPIKYENQLSADYGDNQKFTYTITGDCVPNENGNFVVNIGLPSNFKQAKTVKYEVKYKVSGNDLMIADTVGYVDGKKYTFYYNIDFTSPQIPIIEIKGSCPDSKPFRFYIKANALNIESVKADAKMENFGKFNLDMNIDAMLRSADEFRVKVNIDCEQLNLKKIQFEAFNEAESKGVKKIQFSAIENNKNVLSGSTTYQSRQEGAKYIMEGSGSYKLRDQQKSTSFKYIRDKISEGNEKGVEVFFNVALGEKSTAIEYKNTNLIYKLSSAYCEEKKQCANFDINNKLDVTENSFHHHLQISADLKKLGFIPEFGLQTSTDWAKLSLPTHTFDVHLNLDKSKYHTQAYAKPVKGNYMTAFTMTLPQRVISLESSTSHVNLDFKQSPFPFHHELVFYKNKNSNSQSKVSFKINANVQRVPGKYLNTEGEIVLSWPVFGKDLQIYGKSQYNVPTHEVSGTMTFDIFKKKTQKVVVTSKFSPKINDNSVGLNSLFQIQGNELGFDLSFVDDLFASTQELKVNSKFIWILEKQKRESVFFVEMNKNHQKVQLKYPGSEILNYESNLKSSKDVLAEVQGSICLFQKDPVSFTAEVKTKPYYSFKFVSAHRDGRKFIVSGVLEPLKRSEIRAEVLEGKQQKNLANAGIKMENKSMKPDIHINEVNIKEYAKVVNTYLVALVKQSEDVNKKIQEQATKDIQKTVSSIQNALVDFTEASKQFKEEINKISTELESDKSLQEFVKSFNELIKATMAVVNEFVGKVAGVVHETLKFLSSVFHNTVKLIEEKIVPELSQLYAKISEIVTGVTENIVNLVTFYITTAMEFFEKHRSELQPMIDALNSIFNDVSQMFLKQLDKINSTLMTFFNSVKEYIENSDMLKEFGAHLKHLEIPEKVVNILEGFVGTVSPFIPTDELKVFIERSTDYIKMKIKGEECDDLEQLKLIYNSFEAAIDSLVVYIKSLIGNQDFSISEVPKPNFIKLSKVPKAGLPSFSLFNYLGKEKLPTFEELIMAYRPTSYNPLLLMPPSRLKGLIAGGQHIFTFDGRHLTFPGNCKYVVSQDAVDGNFSIVLTLDKGIAKSINVVAKSGSDIEVNAKNELLYNGSPYGFPLIKSGVLAFKDHDSFTIKTNYGARVRCSLNLDMCYFEVSGFYTGKLRGLLGDGNNEPFDDFRLPNGKISTSESEFGNSYALNSGCGKVKTVDHSHHHGHYDGHNAPGICNKIFSEKSLFNLCYYALDPDNYKQACQHATQGLSEDKAKKEGCLIARAYSLACNSIAVPTLIPDVCSQCEVDRVTYEYENEFDVTTPQNQADIILAVETTKANEKTYKELVVPLISNVIDELKKNKVDDVKIYLVGIVPKLPYPVYYDVNNNAIQKSKIDFKDEQRSKPWESPVRTENEKVDNLLNSFAVLIQKAEIELGLNSIHTSYARLGRLQLRPKAVKSIIMVHSESCPTAVFPLFQMIGSAISEEELKSQGIVTHLITPIEGLKVPKLKQISQVVGFSDDHVFILGDKKRGLSNSALRSSVEYEDDACMDHALKSFGNVYSSKNYATCNNSQKKAFVSMMSQTIVDSFVQVTLERNCKCDTDYFTLQNKVSCTVSKRSDKRKAGSKK